MLDVEDNSVKPSENKCEWCGKSCGSDKYCCNKCKHEHTNADTGILTIVKPAIEFIRDVISMIPGVCLVVFMYALAFAIHSWLKGFNEPYLLISKILPNILQRFLPQTVSNIVADIVNYLLLIVFSITPFFVDWLMSMFIVCLLSTVVYFWFGQFSFVANCILLLAGVGYIIFRIYKDYENPYQA